MPRFLPTFAALGSILAASAAPAQINATVHTTAPVQTTAPAHTAAPATAPAVHLPQPAPPFWAWAPTPPMGWNSWDCYGAGVNEAQTLANAQYMADHLKPLGWQYVTVDIQWYEPLAKGWTYRKGATLTVDGFGRLLPAPNRFPDCTADKGFAPLAEQIHRLGLKFGIHLLRGIPRQAVAGNLPILNTTCHAGDIADRSSLCPWNSDMYGVDMSRPGAQAYYDSVLAQVASWGVDLVKVDDLSRPYHTAEIDAIRRAIDKTGRPIIFSTSPGATPLDQANDIAAHANMWRIADDFWDRWPLLLAQFDRCANWAPFCDAGHYPDADMLPLGAIRTGTRGGHTRFTRDEQITMMTLWSISRSPLIFGGNLPDDDPFTLSLITNPEVIAVDQHSLHGRQVFRRGNLIAWIADVPDSADRYVALFNANSARRGSTQPSSAAMHLTFVDVNLPQTCRVRDLWNRADLGLAHSVVSATIADHGAALFRLTPQ